jgi:hypothetical protein
MTSTAGEAIAAQGGEAVAQYRHTTILLRLTAERRPAQLGGTRQVARRAGDTPSFRRPSIRSSPTRSAHDFAQRDSEEAYQEVVTKYNEAIAKTP